jgi:hypothetical protein
MFEENFVGLSLTVCLEKTKICEEMHFFSSEFYFFAYFSRLITFTFSRIAMHELLTKIIARKLANFVYFFSGRDTVSNPDPH